MTLNLTELRDEPLGKPPIQAYLCVGRCHACTETEQGVVAADDESRLTFDVDGVSDEVLDGSIPRYAIVGTPKALPLPPLPR